MKHHSFDWVNKTYDRGIKKTTVCLKERTKVRLMQQNAILYQQTIKYDSSIPQQNAIIHKVGENNKKYQWASKKDKKIPNQKDNSTPVKEKITKNHNKMQPIQLHTQNE